MASELLKQARARTLQRAGDANHDPAETATPAPTTAPAAAVEPPRSSAPAKAATTAAEEPPPTRTGSFAAPIERVAPNPLNTRDVEERPEKLAALRASIAEHGQMQPSACVTRNAFLAIFGEHEKTVGDVDWVQVGGGRRRAALLLEGEPSIEITVKDSLAATRAGFISATAGENLDRDDLDLIEEARVVQQLLAELGSGNAVAEHLKRAPGWVSQRKYLLQLIPEVQQQMRVDDDNARLPLREVRDWHNLSVDQQRANLDAWRRRRGLSTDDDDRPDRVPRARASRVQAAIKHLGGTPSAIAETLRTELDPAQRRELGEALLRD
jgi:ParB family transcriptional regulator, chromosome partitioning protein